MKHLHMLWLPRVLTTPVAHVLFIFLVKLMKMVGIRRLVSFHYKYCQHNKVALKNEVLCIVNVPLLL